MKLKFVRSIVTLLFSINPAYALRESDKRIKLHTLRCLILLPVLLSERSFSQASKDTLRPGRPVFTEAISSTEATDSVREEQPGQQVNTDTLSVLAMKRREYGVPGYKVLQLRDLDSLGNQIKSTWRIEFRWKREIISSFSLPIPDEEVKNFSVNEITEVPGGFNMAVAWGGGNYFYNRVFHFILIANKFYLNRISGTDYTQEPEKETKINRRIDPAVAFDKVDIRKYIDNDY